MADCSTPRSGEKLEPCEQRLQVQKRVRKQDGGSRGSSRSSSCNTSRESTPKPLPKQPKNQYTREKLMKLRMSPLCKKRPTCMEDLLDCDLPDVIRDEPIGLEDICTSACEPEMWYKHIRHLQDHDSRGNSPLTVGGGGGPERKRFSETAGGDSETSFKKRGTDMRAKEEEDETAGIVLGPQRKSFGTGCHVTATSFSRKNDSPKDHERDGLRSRARIGSGRITVDHERERVGDRSFRAGDRDSGGVRDPPPRRFERGDSRSGFGGGAGERGAYDKDRYQRNRDYDSRDDGRDDRRDRDYNDRRYDSRRSYGRSDSHQQSAPEPEWFTSGPSSQSDTIELVGFDGPRAKESDRKPSPPVVTEDEQQRHYSGQQQRGGRYRQNETAAATGRRRNDNEMEESLEEHKEACVSVADRNGSLETNESSSPEHSQNSDDDRNHAAMNEARRMQMDTGSKDISAGGGGNGAAGESFDLNDIFIKNIPGLSDIIGNIDREVPTPTEAVGSRFSQWFQAGGSRGSTSRENSRRSSINEDFSYLHDLLNGSKSPVIPSPPLTSQHMAMYHYHHPPPPGTTSAGHAAAGGGHMTSIEAAKQQQHILELLGSKGMLPPPAAAAAHLAQQQQLLQQQNNQIHVYHAQQQQHGRMLTSVTTQQGAVSVSDVEASLKALLLPGGKKPPHSEQNSIKNIPNLVPLGGHVLTAEELEASFTSQTSPDNTPTATPTALAANPALGQGQYVGRKNGGGEISRGDIASGDIGFADIPRKILGSHGMGNPQTLGDRSKVASSSNNIRSSSGFENRVPETFPGHHHQPHVFTNISNSPETISSSLNNSTMPNVFPAGPGFSQATNTRPESFSSTMDKGGYVNAGPIYAQRGPRSDMSENPAGLTPAQGRPIYSSVAASHPVQTTSVGPHSMTGMMPTEQSGVAMPSTNHIQSSHQISSQFSGASVEGANIGGMNADFLPRRPSIENNSLLPSAHVAPPPSSLLSAVNLKAGGSVGKVTTVAELEEELGRGVHGSGKMLAGQPGNNFNDRNSTEGLIAAAVQQRQQQQQQQQDLAAFNKLLGLVKGAAGATTVFDNNPDGSQAAHQHLQQMQKESMLQKIVQQQQQQHAKAQQAAAVKQLQHQQVKQQQQQQLQMFKTLISNRHAAGKSPIPPTGPPVVGGAPVNLQPPQPSVSPRCPSPMLQPPVSPRAPSPIMFGSQPPMHLTAPSPIHASPVLPAGGGSNTLQVSQASSGGNAAALARVPSPQELIVHTQAIMQNALIKRQLEEQKERFLKRQQAKSPNPANMSSSSITANTSNPSVVTTATATLSSSSAAAQQQPPPQQQPPAQQLASSTAQRQPSDVATDGNHQTPGEMLETPTVEGTQNSGGNTSVASNMTSTPASTKAAVNPAFTPTSVIRKMVNEKADEKEKEIKHNNDNRLEKPTPMVRIVQGDGDNPSFEDGAHVSVQITDLNNQQVVAPHSAQSSQPMPGNPTIQQSHPQQVVSGRPTARHSVIQGLMNIPPPQQQLFHQPLPQQPSVGPGHGNPPVCHTGMIAPGNPIQPSRGRPILANPSLVLTGSHSKPFCHPALDRRITKGTNPGTNPLSPLGSNQFNLGPAAVVSSNAQRPIMGCATGQQLIAGVSNPSQQIPTVDAMRYLEHQRQLQAQLAAAMPPRGRPITGRRTSAGATPTTPQAAQAAQASMNPHHQPPVNPLAANQALLMQKMMLPGGTSPAAVHQIQQLAALQAQMLQQPQQQQPQQRSGVMDPRLANPPPPQGVGRPIFGASGPGNNNPQHMPVSSGATGAGMGQIRAMQAGRGPPEFPVMTSTAGPGHPILAGATSQDHHGNLAKFFGNDLLKQQFTAMPPLPNQGSQRVLTLEEIERRQQMVSN